jgi:thimet oligopeptidase
MFHEFGHAMHTILTRAKYSRFSGTSVPQDFVEAPSQMLENWPWDKKVLDSFAADYRDPKKKIPAGRPGPAQGRAHSRPMPLFIAASFRSA